MENLIIFKQNLLTFGLTRNKLICDCCKRSAEAESNKEISDDRPKTESIETVILPLASIGEKSGFNDTLAVLKKIDGMTGAKLFFRETAVRIQYDPDRTDVNTISTSLRLIGLKFNDEPIFQDMPIEGIVNI